MRVRRAHSDRIAANNFAEWLLRVGNGTEQTYSNVTATDLIHIPTSMTVTNVDQLINEVFLDLRNEHLFAYRAVLAPRNDEADEINTLVVQHFTGTEYEYRSIDSVAIEDGILSH